jgi:hypothetical protein
MLKSGTLVFKDFIFATEVPELFVAVEDYYGLYGFGFLLSPCQLDASFDFRLSFLWHIGHMGPSLDGNATDLWTCLWQLPQ